MASTNSESENNDDVGERVRNGGHKDSLDNENSEQAAMACRKRGSDEERWEMAACIMGCGLSSAAYMMASRESQPAMLQCWLMSAREFDRRPADAKQVSGILHDRGRASLQSKRQLEHRVMARPTRSR